MARTIESTNMHDETWINHKFKHDFQQYMHTDTYMPSLKVWTFAETTMEHGPFTYVKGSHKITAGKVKWLVERTRRLQPTNELGGQCTGPYSDSTHQFFPALRFVGFDAENPNRPETAHALASYSFPNPTPIVTGKGRTIVIADTNGLHFRHWAQPGTHRYSTTLPGGGRIPRENYFQLALFGT